MYNIVIYSDIEMVAGHKYTYFTGYFFRLTAKTVAWFVLLCATLAQIKPGKNTRVRLQEL